jgi:hypothetical protein
MTLQEDDLLELLGGLCNGDIAAEEEERLAARLREDPAARRLYVKYVDLHLALVDLDAGWQDDSAAGFFVDTSCGVNSDFSQPIFASYLIAATIFCVGLLAGSLVKVSYDRPEIARQSPAEAPRQANLVRAGWIAGTADCRWAVGGRPTAARDPVFVGSRLQLDSGLLEIAYDSGAKVILQGPATYEVDSTTGGSLSLGRLTARVEKRNDERGMMNDERQALHSDIHHSPFTTHHLFSVRTPTAVVSDLGTEFGVEVGREGNTVSHVFRGAVTMQSIGERGRQHVVLRERESARVEKSTVAGGSRLVSCQTDPRNFVRRMVKTPKELDLLDMVAGGDGAGRRRERGIDPNTGLEDPVFALGQRDANHRYRAVGWIESIDGVFVVGGGPKAVQLDSAGHVFDGFPKTSGKTWGSIWPRAAEVDPSGRQTGWIFDLDRRFTPDGRGLLAFLPSVGITFDLEAMRRMYPEARPARFRAVAGLGDRPGFSPSPDGLVDLWVFVDGRLKLKRLGFCRRDGALRVDVELGPTDRFLTLAATDGGDGQEGDWLVLGDPVLEMVSSQPQKPQEGDSMQENRSAL